MSISIPNRQLFIDGKWREPVLKKRIPVINPATEEIIGDIPAATAEDVEIAVEAAQKAFNRNRGKDWAFASGAFRAKFLRATAAKVTERKLELAKLEVIDCGKPWIEAVADMEDVAVCLEYYADLAEGLDAKQKAPISHPYPAFKIHVLQEPIGVVGLITPWNYPLLMATWKLAPALAAGCTAILKPSELASLTCLELAEVCRVVGLPPGVLNVLTGLGPEAGAPLAYHPSVDKIAFTGSTATGSKITASAAQLVKPLSMELGGKSPLIVFDDINIDKAVEWAMFGCFLTSGQICSATSRLLLHESIAPQFVDRLLEWSKNVKISDPLEEDCKLSPVVSRAQHLDKGFFIEPTIITDVTTSMEIWREEVFGPVLCIKTFRTEDEAIDLANDTQYGLGSAVISNDLERCERITKAFRAGIVWINCSQPCFCHAPWGGIKRSGFGRELGEWYGPKYQALSLFLSL